MSNTESNALLVLYIVHPATQTCITCHSITFFVLSGSHKYHYVFVTLHPRPILINSEALAHENHVGTNSREEHSVGESLSHYILYSNRGKARQSEMDCYLGGA